MDTLLGMEFTLMLFFTLFVGWLIAGGFTAYFGAGKSRVIGIFLLLLSLVSFGLFYVIGFMPEQGPFGFVGGSAETHKAYAWDALAASVGAFLGAVISFFFLLGLLLYQEKKAAAQYEYGDETEVEEE